MPEFVYADGFHLSPSENFLIQDFNSDGRDDFVLFSGDATYIYMSEEGRTFQKISLDPGVSDGAEGSDMSRVSEKIGMSGDFNGDGNLDLAVAVSENHEFPDCTATPVALFIYPGTGAKDIVGSPVKIELTGKIIALKAADLSRNGADDIVAVSTCKKEDGTFDHRLYFLQGQVGSPSFFFSPVMLQMQKPNRNPHYLQFYFGDFNQDGLGDFVVWEKWNVVEVHTGKQKDETFFFEDPVVLKNSTVRKCGNCGLTDVNNDGFDDICVWENYFSGYHEPERGDFPFEVEHACFLGSPDNSFEAYGEDLPLLSSRDTICKDFDGDGIYDIAHLSRRSLDFYLGKNDPSSERIFFTKASPQYIPGTFPDVMEKADFDGDGITDFAVKAFHSATYPMTYERGFWIIYGEGQDRGYAPHLAAAEMLDTIKHPIGVIAGDFNENGRQDILFLTGKETNDYGIFIQTDKVGGLRFTGPEFYKFGAPPYLLDEEFFCEEDLTDCIPPFSVMLDINETGFLNKVYVKNNSTCPTCPRYTEIFLADIRQFHDGSVIQGTPTTVGGPVSWGLDVADGTKGIAASDFDGDGTTDLVVAGYHGKTITILLSRPPCLGLPVYLRGDANIDFRMNIADAVMIVLYLFNGTEVPCIAALDVDGDGDVSLDDVIGFLSFLFLQGEAPASPFPFYGPRKEGDALSCDI